MIFFNATKTAVFAQMKMEQVSNIWEEKEMLFTYTLHEITQDGPWGNAETKTLNLLEEHKEEYLLYLGEGKY
jgi:hypothetical protein